MVKSTFKGVMFLWPGGNWTIFEALLLPGGGLGSLVLVF